MGAAGVQASELSLRSSLLRLQGPHSKDAGRGLQSSDLRCVASQLGPGSRKQRVPAGRRLLCARSAERRP